MWQSCHHRRLCRRLRRRLRLHRDHRATGAAKRREGGRWRDDDGGPGDDDVEAVGRFARAGRDDDNDTTISLAMSTATRVAGDKEGDGGKSDDDDTPTSLAMATATRVAGDEECDSGKSNGNDEKGGG